MIYIVDAKYVKPLSVEVLFSDGVRQVLDIGKFIKANPHPQYNMYLTERNFKNFKIEYGNIVWGKNWDLIFPIGNLYKGEVSIH